MLFSSKAEGLESLGVAKALSNGIEHRVTWIEAVRL
jgi:hypothetical protein